MLCEFYNTIEAEGLHMQRRAVERIAVVGRQICVLYGQLSRDAVARHVKAWKISPTFHIFEHLCEWQIPDVRLNPRSFWTYADEDLVGKLVEVAKCCHVSTIAPTAMAKWLILALQE